MPLNNGEIHEIQLQDNNFSCTTPIIGNEEFYKITPDGNIETELHFYCEINGEEHSANPFRINFELKPYIEYAVIEKNSGQFSFGLIRCSL